MAARITQHGIEVLRTDTAPLARVSQTAVESLRKPTGFIARSSHFVVEVMRLAFPSGTSQRPIWNGDGWHRKF